MYMALRTFLYQGSSLLFPPSCVPTYSDKQLVERQKTTARKRRRNQNTEIEELGELLPVVPVQTRQGIDKISVLRLASTYMRFREFLATGGRTCGLHAVLLL